jgi:hypothetical protein
MRDVEHAHQKAVINWCWHTRLPAAADIDEGEKVGDYIFAVPNGSHRSKATAGKLKAEGVKAGVHDLFLPLLRQGFAGLSIELKAPGGRATPEQKEWLRKLRRAGYRAEICFGWTEAADTIAEYLGLARVSTPPKISTTPQTERV